MTAVRAPSWRVRKQGFTSRDSRRRRALHGASMRCAAGSEPCSAGSLAEGLLDRFAHSDSVVAFGDGPICMDAMQLLSKRIDTGRYTGISVAAASRAAASEAAFLGLTQVQVDDCNEIDLMLADVDEIVAAHSAKPFIFGRRSTPQQPQILRFQSLARKASKFVAILDSGEQVMERLGRELPLLVSNDSWEVVAEEVDDLVLGDAEVWRRPEDPGISANPRGGDNPFVSEDGDTILDVKFYGDMCFCGKKDLDYDAVVKDLMAVEGMQAVGLSVGVATDIVVCASGQLTMVE